MGPAPTPCRKCSGGIPGGCRGMLTTSEGSIPAIVRQLWLFVYFDVELELACTLALLCPLDFIPSMPWSKHRQLWNLRACKGIVHVIYSSVQQPLHFHQATQLPDHQQHIWPLLSKECLSRLRSPFSLGPNTAVLNPISSGKTGLNEVKQISLLQSCLGLWYVMNLQEGLPST